MAQNFVKVVQSFHQYLSESQKIKTMSNAEDIQKQIQELQSKLDCLKKNARSKIDKMSSEVKDSNPYSRLMALQRMGIVQDYERIRTKSVAVVGKIIFKTLLASVSHR